MNIKNLLKIALGVLVILGLVIKFVPIVGVKGRRMLAERFVDKNLTQIINTQEKELDIKYLVAPKILYTNSCRESVASYSAEEIAIRLATDTTYFTVTGNHTINWSVGLLLGTARTVNLRNTLNHELSHFYMDRLIRGTSDEILRKLNPNTAGDLDELMNRLIQEGIADYIEDRMVVEKKVVGPLRDVIVDQAYFSKHANDFYSVALELVKPIIDRHKSRGIEYLVLHSLDGTRLRDLSGFQKKALLELSVKSSVITST